MVRESVETHLSESKCKMIPNEDVKGCCGPASARKERVLLLPSGLAFKNYETGVFLTELLQKSSQEKCKEGRKQETGKR